MRAPSASQRVRAQLSHPVIDADGHQVNFDPGVEDYVRAIGGPQYAVRYVPRVRRRMEQSHEERPFPPTSSSSTSPSWTGSPPST